MNAHALRTKSDPQAGLTGRTYPTQRQPRTLRGVASILATALFLLSSSVASAYFEEDDDEDWGDEPSYQIHGFVEAATGARIVADSAAEDVLLLNEARFRLEATHENDLGRLSFKGDFNADGITKDIDIDIRQAMVYFRLGNHVDVRAGRQTLTWGTGDLLFLNDLFPKDWVSFFIGRDDEYLKAPSTAIKMGFYSKWANLDLVWTPVFQADRFITGRRLTFFDPLSGNLLNGNGADIIDPRYPNKEFRKGEFAGRLYRRIKSFEVALYGYAGFWKQPLGIVMPTDQGLMPTFTFPRLSVYGASLRGPVLGGIFNVEGAFYHSWDDSDGTKPFIPNHQVRGLVGYEHEVIPNMTLSGQYYLEYITQYDELEANSPFPRFEQEELRHVTTLRWTYMLMRNDLMLSLFAFFSPSEMDTYIRPVVTYKLNDAIKLTAGANVVVGDDNFTFFGRLEDNTNVYGRVRYTF